MQEEWHEYIAQAKVGGRLGCQKGIKHHKRIRKSGLTRTGRCYGVDERWCNSCKTHLTVENFVKNRTTVDGLQQRCKDCTKREVEKPRVRILRIFKNAKSNSRRRAKMGRFRMEDFELPVHVDAKIKFFEDLAGECPPPRCRSRF